MENIRDLPGFRKKSFSMAFRGGEIWFEHLDGIYQQEALVLEKLKEDRKIFCRPSVSSLICFNLDETVITDEIINEITDILTHSDKQFRKVCFVGANRLTKKTLSNQLEGHGFLICFIHDFEKAKEWLVS